MNDRIRRPLWTGWIIALLVLLSTPGTQTGWAGSELRHIKRVLLLNSYHHGFFWSDNVVRGIQAELAGATDPVELYIEYMDTRRRYDDQAYIIRLFDFLKYKYPGQAFDVIIATDDNSYNFLRKYGDRLFRSTPVVFCGVNFFRADQLRNVSQFTGILEGIDIDGTVRIATRIFPAADKIVFLTDRTSYGKMMRSEIERVSAKNRHRALRFEIFDNFSLQELMDKTRRLESGTLLVYVAIHQDKNGLSFEPSEHLPEIIKNTSVPLFAVDDHLLALGIMGGSLKSGFFHGKSAAKRVLRILQGESADSIPIQTQPKFFPILNYNRLKHFKVDFQLIPEEIEIYNKPFSFYETYKPYVIGISVVFVVLVSLVGSLLQINFKRKKAEQRLLKSEEQYRLLAHNVADVIWTVDHHQQLTYISPSILQLTGHTPEELHGRPISGLITEASFQSIQQQIVCSNRKNRCESFVVESKVDTKAGRTIWSETRAQGLYDEKGGPLGIIGCTRDITPRKMAEHEKEKLESQLRHSQRLESIGTLANGIAHDFNNILASIIGYSEIALYDDLEEDSPARHDLQQILVACKRAKDLIQQILTFSRQPDTPREPLRLSPIIKETIKFLKATLPKGITISGMSNTDCDVILGHPNEVHQIIMNLCTNAAQAILSGNGTISIDLFPVTEADCRVHDLSLLPAGKYVGICVVDAGIGMSPAIQEHIFEPFFTTRKNSGGSGLGLAVVHGIVSGMGGTIKVKSEVGKGTAISVFLPIISDEPDAPLHPSDIQPGIGERILLVDDESSVLEIGRHTLTVLGYRVVATLDPQIALTYFQDSPHDFDLLLTDYSMPGMNGLELAQKMKKIRPDLPVILGTGHGKPIDRDRLERIGLSDYIAKPLNRVELSRAVRKALTMQPE